MSIFVVFAVLLLLPSGGKFLKDILFISIALELGVSL